MWWRYVNSADAAAVYSIVNVFGAFWRRDCRHFPNESDLHIGALSIASSTSLSETIDHTWTVYMSQPKILTELIRHFLICWLQLPINLYYSRLKYVSSRVECSHRLMKYRILRLIGRCQHGGFQRKSGLGFWLVKDRRDVTLDLYGCVK
jgi:hypothetical protein